MKAIGYIRVSTDQQAEHGVSIDAQQAAIVAYCAMRGLELADVVIDAGISGGTPLAERKGGQIIAAAIKAKQVHAIVAYKLDRIFRDASDCLAVTTQWDKANVSMHLIDMGGQSIDTATAMGRFFLTVMAGAAELEKNLIGERTAAAMQHKKAQGQRVGAIPYGYSLANDGSTLEPNPAEQKVIAAIQELQAAGLSLRGIAKELAQRGYATRTGKAFAPVQVSRLIAA